MLGFRGLTELVGIIRVCVGAYRSAIGSVERQAQDCAAPPQLSSENPVASLPLKKDIWGFRV